jgi:hypothetical protein
VGLTGVIYAAIVVAWAIFLVPLALRRHDQTARNRSIERFSSSMRVLSTGGRDATSSPVVVTPPRQEDNGSVPSSPEPVEANGASAVPRPASRAAAKAAAARRRRVLGILLVLCLVTGAVSVVGLIPAWSVAVPGLLIAVFLVIARRQVRIANRSYAKRAGARSVNSDDVRRSAARVEASPEIAHDPKASTMGADACETPSPAPDEQDPADEEPTITLSAAEVAAARAEDQPEAPVVEVRPVTADSGSLWDPLPITLPAYVDKPVAKRSVRKIAIGEAGTSSAGHAAAAASTGVPRKAHQADGAAAGADDQDTDAAGERPRAANA